MKLKNFLSSYMLCIIAVIIMSFPAFSAGAGKKKTEKPEKLVIKADDKVNYNIENENMVIPGGVNIEYGEFTAHGKNLRFDNKSRKAELDGDPLVKIVYGKEMTMDARRISVDLDTQMASLAGDCKAVKDNNNESMEIETETILIDMKSKIMKSDKIVKLHYKSKKAKKAGSGDKKSAAEGQGAGAAEKTGEKKKKEAWGNLGEIMPKINSGEFNLTTGNIVYDYGNGRITADAPIKMIFEEGYMEAGTVYGDLDKKTLDFYGGIQGVAGGTKIKADTALLKYGSQELTADGNIVLEKSENNMKFNARHVYMKYKEGERSLKIDGGVELQMKMDKKNK